MTARTRNVMAAALVGAIATVTLGAGVARAQTAAEVAAANNPLAPITAINLQNYTFRRSMARRIPPRTRCCSAGSWGRSR